MAPATVAEAWDAFQQERVPIDVPLDTLVLVRRAYYAAALDVLAIRDRKPAEPIRAEVLDWARGVVGRAVERAR
jgi:hypothetical protein